MSQEDVIYAHQHEVGSVVYLVEDTADGPRRSTWCEVVMGDDGRHQFLAEGDHRESIAMPDDGRRDEVLPVGATPGFAQPAAAEWKRGVWLIVDIETTGWKDPAIVELGAVIMQEGKVVDYRSALFNPGKPIDGGASAVHGIYDRHVAHRPRIDAVNPTTGRTPAEGLDALAAAHDVTCIVAYNGLTFDLRILRAQLGDRWQMLMDSVGLFIDPIVVVRRPDVGKFWKGEGRHQMGAVARTMKLDGPEPGIPDATHRAVRDCVLTGRILWRLRAHVPDLAIEARPLFAGKHNPAEAML